MLRFRKVTSRNLKIGKLPVTLKVWNFGSYLWWNLTQSQVDLKTNLFSRNITKKPRGMCWFFSKQITKIIWAGSVPDRCNTQGQSRQSSRDRRWAAQRSRPGPYCMDQKWINAGSRILTGAGPNPDRIWESHHYSIYSIPLTVHSSSHLNYEPKPIAAYRILFQLSNSPDQGHLICTR